MNNNITVLGTKTVLGQEVKHIEGGFGDNQKCVLAKDVAIIHEKELFNINRDINTLISKNRMKEGIHFINLLNSCDEYRILAENLGLIGSNRTKDVFLLSERGYASLIKYMDDDKSWEVHEDFIDNYFKMKTALSRKQEIALELVDLGGLKSVTLATELSKIVSDEETAKAKDGRNQILTCGQVVKELCIEDLTTTILHEFLCIKGYGNMVKPVGAKRRCFQPTEKFNNIVAKVGMAYTGTTEKQDKTKAIYSVSLVDYLKENYYEDLKQYTYIKVGKEVA